MLQQDKDGNTPLHLACEASYGGCDTKATVEVVNFLIKKGGKDLAEKEANNNDNPNPTSLAIKNNFPLETSRFTP